MARLQTIAEGFGPSEEHIRVLEAYRREYGIPVSLPYSTAAFNRAVDWWNAGATALDPAVDQLEETPRAPLARVVPGQDMTEAYWRVLDAFRRSRGLPPWRSRRDRAILTAVEVNEAVEWWNARDDECTPNVPTED